MLLMFAHGLSYIYMYKQDLAFMCSFFFFGVILYETPQVYSFWKVILYETPNCIHFGGSFYMKPPKVYSFWRVILYETPQVYSFWRVILSETYSYEGVIPYKNMFIFGGLWVSFHLTIQITVNPPKLYMQMNAWKIHLFEYKSFGMCSNLEFILVVGE